MISDTSYLNLIIDIAKLSFNFNYNLVESWDSINLIFHTHHPPIHPQEKFKKHLGINNTIAVAFTYLFEILVYISVSFITLPPPQEKFELNYNLSLAQLRPSLL